MLPARVTQADYDDLRKALADERPDRWHRAATRRTPRSRIDLSQVVYVRLDTEEQRVGF